jgi:hypothetical protein
MDERELFDGIRASQDAEAEKARIWNQGQLNNAGVITVAGPNAGPAGLGKAGFNSDWIGEWRILGGCPQCGSPIFAKAQFLAPPRVHRSCRCKNSMGGTVKLSGSADPEVVKVMATAVVALLKLASPAAKTIDSISSESCVKFLEQYIYGEGGYGQPVDEQSGRENEIQGHGG